MSPRKMIAAALCFALLAGCAAAPPRPTPTPTDAGSTASAALSESAAPTESQTETAAEYLVSGRYFDRVARPDIPFDEMKARRWTEDDIEIVCRGLRQAAQNGSTAEFHAACTVMDEVLDGIITACALADLESDAHAGDELLLQESSRLYNLYNRASTSFTACLSGLWCAGAAVMENEFTEWELESFEDYDEESSTAALELFEREDELLTQYVTLSSAGDGQDDGIAEVFVELVSVRNELAELLGYDSYADYAYVELYSRAYTPEQAQNIWSLAREALVPLYTGKYQRVQEAAESSRDFRRMDCSAERVISALRSGAQRMSPEISGACEYMLSHGLCDLEYSDEKLPVGYTVWLPDYVVPYVFNAPYDLYYDYQDAFHEFGHFVSYFYCGSDGSGWDDFDLSELQSQGMEMMFLSFYDDIFGETADLMRAQTVLRILGSVLEGAMYDEFQQRVYAEDDLTPERVDEIFAELYKDFGYMEYKGYEREWMLIGHNFESPFYYISYAVSALPALELFVRAQSSPADAMDTYLRVAAMSSEYYSIADALAESGLADWLESPDAEMLTNGIYRSGVLDV